MIWSAASPPPSLSLEPNQPGVIVGSGVWTTTVSSPTLTQFQWAIYSEENIAYNSWQVVDLTSTESGSNEAELTVTFQLTGDYLVVSPVGNPTEATLSYPVQIVDVPITIQFDPVDPGTIGADASGGAPWTTTLIVSGVDEIQWAVFNSAGQQRAPWATLQMTDGQASLHVEFQATGDYVTAAYGSSSQTSGPVTVSVQAGAGGTSLSFAASGALQAKGTAAAILEFDISAAGNAKQEVSAAGDLTLSLSLSGDVIPGMLAEGSLSFQVTPAGTSNIAVVATGTITVEPLQAAGSTTKAVSAAGSLALPLSPASSARASRSVAGSLTLSAPAPAGAASGLDPSAGVLALSLSQAGVSAATLDAAGSGKMTTSAAGIAAITRTGTGAISTTIEVSGHAAPVIAAAGTLSLRLVEVGTAANVLVAAGALSIQPVPTGTAIGTLGAVGAVSMQETVVGAGGPYVTASGTLDFSFPGSAGLANPVVSAHGTVEFGPLSPFGSSSNASEGSVSFALTAVATAKITNAAAGSTTLDVVPSSNSGKTDEATGILSVSLTAHGQVSNGAAGSVTFGPLEVSGSTIGLASGTATATVLSAAGTVTAVASALGRPAGFILSASGTLSTTASIYLEPANPGTITAGGTWSTEVITDPILQGTTITGGSGGGPTTVPFTGALLQGQSNADWMINTEYANVPNTNAAGLYQTAVELLTGLPHILFAADADPTSTAPDPSGGNTILSGEPTYDTTNAGGDSANLWLNGYNEGSNPANWPLGQQGTYLENYIKYWITPTATAPGGGVNTTLQNGVPLVFIRMHSEYDSVKTGTDLSYYAAANMSLLERAKGWCNLPAGQFMVAYVMPAYVENSNQTAIDDILGAWVDDILGTSGATYPAFWGTTNNQDTWDRTDLSHMDQNGDTQVALRLAISVSAHLFEKGYSKNDLTQLPKGGPYITSFSVVNGNQLQVNVAHDKGTDLIIPAATTTTTVNSGYYTGANQQSNLQAFAVSDANGARTVTAVTYNNATSFLLTLDQAPSGTVTLTYCQDNNYYGPNNLITDNWHTTDVSKPQWMVDILFTLMPKLTLPLRRTDAPIVGAGTAATIADPPVSPIPSPAKTHNSSPVATSVPYGVGLMSTNNWTYGYYTPNSQSCVIAGGTTAASFVMYNANGTASGSPAATTIEAQHQNVPTMGEFSVSWSNGQWLKVYDPNHTQYYNLGDPLYLRGQGPGSTNPYTYQTAQPINGDTPPAAPGGGTTVEPAMITWQVFDSAGTGEGSPTTLDLTDGSVEISPISFENTGDYVHVTVVGGTLTVNSGAVTIEQAPNFEIALSVSNPGTLTQNVSQGGGALWKPTATVSSTVGGGTPTYVQENFAVPTNVSSVGVSFVNANVAGNAIIVLVGQSDAATQTITSVTDSNGNTYELVQGPDTEASGQQAQSIYAAFNIKAGANSVSVVFGGTVAYPDVRILEYADVESFDTGASAGGDSTTASVSLATTVDNELVVAGCMVATGVTGIGAGWNSRVVTTPNADNAQDIVVATPGTVTATATMSAGGWLISAAGFKPPGGGTVALPSTLNYWVENSSGTSYGGTLTATLVDNAATLFCMFQNSGDKLVVADPTGVITTTSGSVTITPVAASINASGTGPSPVDPTGWQLIMDSEFVNETTLDANWSIVGGYVNNGTTYMQEDASPWSFSKTMGLQGQVWNNGTQWVSGSIMAGLADHPGFWQSYNGKGGLPMRVETKFYYPDANGLGAYMLMWPYTDDWTSELDLIEVPLSTGAFANAFMFTWHDPTGVEGGGTPDTSQEAYYPKVNRTQWHVLTCEYDTTGIRLWIDGAEQLLPGQPGFTGTESTPGGWWSEIGTEYDAWDDGQYAPKDPMSLGIAGLEFDSSAFGGPPASTSTVYNFYHAYVRCWIPNTNNEGGAGGSANNPGPLTSTTQTPAQIAQGFVADLAFGVHLPRGQYKKMTWNNTPVYASSGANGYWAYLAGLGVTHVAFSFPWSPVYAPSGHFVSSISPSVTDPYWTSLLTAVKNANAAGLKTVVRFMDNINVGQDNSNSQFYPWLTAAGTSWAGSGLAPGMNLMVGHGEMIGSNNATCNPVLQEVHNTLRAVLPQSGGWIIGIGGAYWQSSNALLASQSKSGGTSRVQVTNPATGTTDMQTIYMCDDYPYWSKYGGITAVESGYATNMANYQKAYGCVMMQHETGDWHISTSFEADPGNPAYWANAYMKIAQGSGQFAPCLWDISSSDGYFNMAANSGASTAALYGSNGTALSAACSYIKSQSYFGNGAIR